MTSWPHFRMHNIWLAGLVFFLICACSGCQAAPTSSPLPSATVSLPTTAPTRTPLPNTPTSLPTSTLRPTGIATKIQLSPTPEPSETPEEAGLSPDGPWLALPNIELDGLGYQHLGVVLVNQDGSGRVELDTTRFCGSAQNPIIEHPANTVVKLGWSIFLVNPKVKTSCILCGWGYGCSDETGIEQNLLVAKYWEGANSITELRIHRLPEGTLLESFPLMQCQPVSDACDLQEMAPNPHAWDPAGQKLAFSVTLDSGTALHVYDVASGIEREVTRLDGGITYIWWSPDGANLVLGVVDLLDPYNLSIQTVPLAGGSPRMVYTVESPFSHQVITWVDDHRFLDCEGSLQDVVMEGAYNLRMVDIRSAEVTMLLNDGFVDVALDRESETVVVVNAVYTSIENQGLYLISLADPKPVFMGPPMSYQVEWDADRGLYLTGTLCPDDADLLLAFDPLGKVTCLPLEPEPAPPPPPDQSPDGKWSVTLENGLWIEGPGQPRVKVLDETPGYIIWRPDSGGLFAALLKDVVHISLPDLQTRPLPRGTFPFTLDPSEGYAYQWIGN